jgi:glutathione synthase/RimK-type ligase-like ATP-grasp enzyme
MGQAGVMDRKPLIVGSLDSWPRCWPGKAIRLPAAPSQSTVTSWGSRLSKPASVCVRRLFAITAAPRRMMRVALVTYAGLPQLAADDRLLRRALRERGHRADAVVWDDPDVAWQDYDLIVVRSCWDYHLRPGAFLAWIARLEALGAPLWNPPGLLRWNLDKRYLLDLAARGVPVVPTVYLERGARADLAALLAERGWGEAVVKPAVAATAFHTWRTSAAAEEQERFAALLAERSMLVQPLMPQIAGGEWSLLCFGGTYSHAVLKRPAPGDFRSQDDFGGTVEPREPPPGLVAQGMAMLAQLATLWLYARVDGLLVDGMFTLMELELIEPSLFLDAAPAVADQLAAACERYGRG